MNFLKNSFILLLTLQLALPFAMENVLRLPALISHYFHHHHEHNSTLSDFLADHYTQKPHRDDDESHHDLPFHKHSYYTLNQIIAIVYELRLFEFIKHNYKESKDPKLSHFQDFFPASVSLSIWKPPKFSL